MVINAAKAVISASSEHINTMVVLEKPDIKELATIKGLLDAVLIMIKELPETESSREKELFEEKNLCHSFLIQQNLMKEFQSFKERKTESKK